MCSRDRPGGCRGWIQLRVVLLLVFSGCGAGSQPAAPPSAAVAQDLKIAESGTPQERCKALGRLGRHWRMERATPKGFSDVPVPQPPAARPPIADEDLNGIATLLQNALRDGNADVRKEAGICLRSAPRTSSAVEAAIAVALNSEDGNVLWSLEQLDFEKHVLPEPSPFVPNLISHLKSKQYSSFYVATALIQRYGKRFLPYTDAVVDSLPDIPKEDRWRVLLSLGEVGLTESAAARLVETVATAGSWTKAAAFVPLISRPEAAARLLRGNRDLGEALAEFDQWSWLLYSAAPEHQELRTLLATVPNLGPLNLALIGSPDAIPDLTKQLETASRHRQSRLRACLRACGGDLGTVVHVSQDVPLSFRPKSAWPESDSSRRSGTAGHGDGFTEILVTGELRFADGTHPAQPTLLRLNDQMLLGESRSEPMPLKYDATTGRFVLRTSIFAAYDTGMPPEPGPYQTGSAQIRIEATEATPLVTQFFDEMPHVIIELKRR